MLALTRVESNSGIKWYGIRFKHLWRGGQAILFATFTLCSKDILPGFMQPDYRVKLRYISWHLLNLLRVNEGFR